MKNKHLCKIFVFALLVFLIIVFGYSKVSAISNTILKDNQNDNSLLLLSRINSLSKDILKTNFNTSIQIQEAKEKKELMKELMRKNPLLFNAFARKSNDTEQLSTISGNIINIIVDGEKDSHNKYYIDTPTMRYSFYPTSETPFISGTNVKVTGYIIDNQISTNVNENPILILGNGPILNSTGDQRTLVFLIKSFSGDSEPFTPALGHEFSIQWTVSEVYARAILWKSFI